MSAEHLNLSPQHTYQTKGRKKLDGAWWYEELNGLHIIVDTEVGTDKGSIRQIRITWRQVIDALERRYKRNDQD